VVYAASDPNPPAAGGGEWLRRVGVAVFPDADPARARARNPIWTPALEAGRPFVTLKTAVTLDGRIAAADGTSRWITGPEARAHAHAFRAQVDAILVGTGTLLADDPELTARPPGGPRPPAPPRTEPDLRAAARPQQPVPPPTGAAPDPDAAQPVRAVMGWRYIPDQAKVRGPGGGELVHLRTRDPAQALAELAKREIRHVLVEGGAVIAGAFLRAGLVDQLHAYVEPMFLGAGTPAAPDLGIATLAAAPRWQAREVALLGPTAFIRAAREPVLTPSTHRALSRAGRIDAAGAHAKPDRPGQGE
jgi:diaminohydroxyphosphoribosylaminopyrimidine deaminase/5-amino-6-(5-phosphoribosylamino)uracil reductase